MVPKAVGSGTHHHRNGRRIGVCSPSVVCWDRRRTALRELSTARLRGRMEIGQAVGPRRQMPKTAVVRRRELMSTPGTAAERCKTATAVERCTAETVAERCNRSRENSDWDSLTFFFSKVRETENAFGV